MKRVVKEEEGGGEDCAQRREGRKDERGG